MNNERTNSVTKNGEPTKDTTEPTTKTKPEEKRDDDHDHLWIDLGGEG